MKQILFSTEMVRAILDGRKTVTRRVVREPFYIDDEDVCCATGEAMHRGINITHGMPYSDSLFRPGDILYMRETWKQAVCDPAGGGYALTDLYLYKADEPIDTKGMDVENRWHPSIHMPKEAARLFLRVKNVRVERLKEIGDCTKEGIPHGKHATAHMNDYDERCAFASLWNSTIKKADLPLYGWDANPWVWVIEFEKIDKGGKY